MVSATLNELSLLRKGTLDVSQPLSFAQLSASALFADLRTTHAFVFQQRTIGRKQEIGFARQIEYRLVLKPLPKSLFHGARVYPVLVDCFLVSAYDDMISEITWSRRINVRPVAHNHQAINLSFGRGYKLDKSVDGWAMKSLLRRKTALSLDLLRNRGWQFDLLPPFSATVS